MSAMLAYLFALLVTLSLVTFGLVTTAVALIFVVVVAIPAYALKDIGKPPPRRPRGVR